MNNQKLTNNTKVVNQNVVKNYKRRLSMADNSHMNSNNFLEIQERIKVMLKDNPSNIKEIEEKI